MADLKSAWRIPVEGGAAMIVRSPRDIDAETAMRIYSSGQTPLGFAISSEGQSQYPEPVPRQPGYREKSAAFQQWVTGPIRKPIAAATTGAFNLLTPPSPNPEMQAYNKRFASQAGEAAGTFAGEMALPSTPEGQAISTLLMLPVVGQALGGASRLAHAPQAVTNAIRAASRMAATPTATLPRQLLTLPAAGTAAGATTSENPVLGGLGGGGLGLVPPTLAGGMRASRGGGRLINDWATRNRNIVQSEAQSERALSGMLTDMPTLTPAVQNISTSSGVKNATGILEALADERIGKQALKDAFGDMQQAISTGLQQGGIQALTLPALATTRTGITGSFAPPPAALAQYLPGSRRAATSFTPDEAMARLKEVAWSARRMAREGATPAERRAAIELDHAVDQEFRDALVAAGRPDLARQFLNMSNQYRKGVQYFNFWDEALSASRIGTTAPGETTTPMFDWIAIKQLLRSTDKGLSRVEFPGIYQALWSNAPIGATDVFRGIGGNARFFANANAALPGGSFSLPRFQFLHPQGEPQSLAMPTLERLGPGLMLGPLSDEQLKRLNQRNLRLAPVPR